MSHPLFARGSRSVPSFAVTGLVLAAIGVAGCSSQPHTARASVESCFQFGVSAIRHHVTVTTLPSACRGLTAAQIDSAVGAALRSAGNGVRAKALRRQRIVQASHYLTHMYVALPAPRSEPQQLTRGTRWISRTTLSLLALGAWLVTVALGLSLLARRAPRGGMRRRLAAGLRLPALNRAHLGLAAVSLLAWVVYLATSVTGIAWGAAGLLPLVAGLGMALVFLPRQPGSADIPGRRAPVLTVAAHVIFATATILFAVLAAIGTS